MYNLYLENGYLNMEAIIEMPIPFIFVIGGRGIGKTYGTLKYLMEHENVKMLMLRRTQTQIDLVNTPSLSPLTPTAKDLGFEFEVKKIAKNYCGLYTAEEHRLFAFTAAMSTFSNVRGFDAQSFNFIFYDEFIPERGERVNKTEGEKFVNMIETVNRNRELQGGEPVKVICASNSNDIDNLILREMNLVDIAARMQDKKQSVYINNNRGVAVIMPKNSPISEAKAGTALYKAVSNDSDFYNMAIGNKFEHSQNIKSEPIKEFKPIVSIGTVTIYVHKSRGYFYVSRHKAGGCTQFSTDTTSLVQFKVNYRWLIVAHMAQEVHFESLSVKQDFEKFLL